MSTTLSWSDRLALIEHFNPSIAQILSAFHITEDEWKAAQDMETTGAFQKTKDIDYSKYTNLFHKASEIPIGVTSSSARDRLIASTIKTTVPETSSKRPAGKRGHKGNKIQKAFKNIPREPTDVKSFAHKWCISIAVLRQSSRFDKTGGGTVHVRKNKETKVSEIWRDPLPEESPLH